MCFAITALSVVPLTSAQTTSSSAVTGANRIPVGNSTSKAERPSSLLLQQLEMIKRAALTDPYTYRQLAYLAENIGARPSGSAGAARAVDYVAEQMRELALEVHREAVRVPHWVRGIETAELLDSRNPRMSLPRAIALTALGGSTSTGPAGIEAELVIVDSFDELNALGREKISGRIVLFNKKFDRQKAAAGLAFNAYREVVDYRENGPHAAAALGAVAALVRSIDSAAYRLPHTGDSEPAGIPAAAVCDEDAELMVHQAQQGPVSIHLVLTPQKLPDETSYNVIGDIKGNEHPEQIIIVSAHLDSWDLGRGAIDDGAGVAVVLEAAHLLHLLQLRHKRTVRFIAWMDEERSGSGSMQYLKDYASELSDHVAAIEMDVGAGRPLGFALNMRKPVIDAMGSLASAFGSIGASIWEQTTRPPGTTDIAALADKGVPVIGMLQDQRHYYDYHHSAADTIDKVTPSELSENAAAVAMLSLALADMELPPPP